MNVLEFLAGYFGIYFGIGVVVTLGAFLWLFYLVDWITWEPKDLPQLSKILDTREEVRDNFLAAVLFTIVFWPRLIYFMVVGGAGK